MAKIYCKYHRDVPGRHRCARCGIAYCQRCIKGDEPRCPVCASALESLGIGNTIQPFWLRLPQIFAYPATPGVLGYLALLSLASIFMVLPLVGWLVGLVITYVILKYGYVILEASAQGNLSPEHVTLKDPDQNNYLPIKQLGVFVVMLLVVTGVAHLVPPLSLPAWLFFMLAVPASVIVLAMSESFLQALNPVRLAWTMHRIGWSYLLLYAFLILLLASSSAGQNVLRQIIPDWLFVMAGTFIGGYFTLIMFHLMGYVVYQYHERLGYAGVREFEDSGHAVVQAVAPCDRVLAEVDILLAEGKTDEAKQRLAAAVVHSNESALHDRYHKLLLTLGDKGVLAEHARQYISILMQRNERARALDVLVACGGVVPGFGVDDADHALALAQFATGVGRHDAALRSLSGYAKRFPGHANIPVAYFLAAKLLCEHKNDFAQALQILRSLLAKFPDHPSAEQVRRYLSFVEGLEVIKPA